MSAYGRIAVKIAQTIGEIQTSVVTIRKMCSPTRPACVRLRGRGGAARARFDRGVGHASASWKLFQTKMTIGTSEITSSTTAIAEP